MPEITRKLKLKKPIFETEAADIRVINENMDSIDKFAEDMENENDTKYDKTGGTISGNVTITGDIIGNKDMFLTSVLTASDVYLTSDKRLKNNIRKIGNPIEKLKQINGYTFNWVSNNESSGGVIAQELLPVIPELVIESNNYYRVNYNGVIALLIEVNKALIEEIEKLKKSEVR